ncbi:MAG: carbohydrate kinase, partial [Clostridia bacterium]|nr:carbohydrate kinase [Clostridia bacterium]
MELTRNRLTEIFTRYADLKIALVGDLFLDQWFEIDPSLNEISLETGKTAHQVVGRRTSPGAGGNVLSNLAAMGAGKLWVISLIGHDGIGWELLQLLKARGIDVSRILWSDAIMTPSYIKPMSPDEGERFDIKNFTTTPTELENELIDRLQTVAAEADAVILLDQVCEPDCGVITERVRAAAAKAAEANPDTLFIADSRAFA